MFSSSWRAHVTNSIVYTFEPASLQIKYVIFAVCEYAVVTVYVRIGGVYAVARHVCDACIVYVARKFHASGRREI